MILTKQQVKESIQDLGITINQFSKVTGINRNTLYKLTADNYPLKPSRLQSKKIELGIKFIKSQREVMQ